MKTPKNFIQDKILVPAYQFRKNYLSRSMLYTCCNKVANFIFDKSKETALIMLVFNAISILSSHISQINGLKKSSRENKDYLITQEWQEMGMDILFTILPPFFINNYLMKKLDSGQWTTKSARKNLIDVIAPTVGAAREDLYNTDHIRPMSETIGSYTAQVTAKLKKIENLPSFIKKLIKKIEENPNVRLPNPNRAIPRATMEDITTDFDIIRKKTFKGFYNGSAYDEINGQRNGMLIMATIGYTILASAIITPILKNKLANRTYEKNLRKKEKELENANLKHIHNYSPPDRFDILDVFSTFDNSISNSSVHLLEKTRNEDITKNSSSYKNPFEKFDTFSKSSQPSGMRI